MTIKYEICLKNHATMFVDYLVDRCREFVKKGNDGTKEAYICANCGCLKKLYRMNSHSLYRPPIRSRFFRPRVHPHGDDNVPIISHHFMYRFVPIQYIRMPVCYNYSLRDKIFRS